MGASILVYVDCLSCGVRADQLTGVGERQVLAAAQAHLGYFYDAVLHSDMGGTRQAAELVGSVADFIEMPKPDFRFTLDLQDLVIAAILEISQEVASVRRGASIRRVLIAAENKVAGLCAPNLAEIPTLALGDVVQGQVLVEQGKPRVLRSRHLPCPVVI